MYIAVMKRNIIIFHSAAV